MELFKAVFPLARAFCEGVFRAGTWDVIPVPFKAEFLFSPRLLVALFVS